MRGLAFDDFQGSLSGVERPVAWRVAAFALVLALTGANGALALDSNRPADGQAPLKRFDSVEDALRDGLDDLKAGDTLSSLKALTYAAEGGQPLAQWKLGRMYANGEGVAKDEVKAFHFFEALVENYFQNYDDETPTPRNAAAISSAFVEVGVYCLKGISGSEVKPDPERSVEMFNHAATYFGDPEAQYRLARMYLEGAGGLGKNKMLAAHWLALASEKRHHGAEALLGHLLFVGDGVPRQRARGLMFLSMARNGAGGPKDEWIRELYEKDFAAASPDDRQVAFLYLDQRNNFTRVAQPPHEVWPFGAFVPSLPPFPQLFSRAPMPVFESPVEPPPPPGQ